MNYTILNTEGQAQKVETSVKENNLSLQVAFAPPLDNAKTLRIDIVNLFK